MIAAIVVGLIFKPSNTGYEIQLSQDSYTVEYGELFVVPQATCTSGEEVTVSAYDADGYEVTIEYGTVTFEKGENKLVYKAGSLMKEVPVLCADTLAPEVSVSHVATAAVGHWYYLPKFTATDVSGVDKSKSAIALYKGDESEPVATDTGARVRIEEADSYTVKITVGDNDGNVDTYDYPVEVISHPDTEVLEDFSEEIIPYHDTWYGSGGDTIQKWYDEYDGHQGVVSMGCAESKDIFQYAWFTGLNLDDVDLVGCSKLIFRLKVDSSICRQVCFMFAGNMEMPVLWSRAENDPSNQWIDVAINLTEISFVDINHTTIGIAIATEGFGECVWLDQIVADYRPLPEYTVTIENGTMDWAYDTVTEGCHITITHDDSKTPDGKCFIYWKANGKRLWSDTIQVNEDLVIEPVYTTLIENEVAIPDGAVMVNDFSVKDGVTLNENWGSPNTAISAWYRSYAGAAGVRSFGFDGQDDFGYAAWEGVLPANFDYDSYTHLTFRMKVGSDTLRAIWAMSYTNGDLNMLNYVSDFDQWIYVTVKIKDIKGFVFGIANAQAVNGELVLLDQIYASVRPDYSKYEKAIPDGAYMLQDFSDPVGPYNNPNWGSGAEGVSRWYEQYDGVYGVQSFGFKSNEDFMYTLWGGIVPEDVDISAYTHVTIRLKANKDVLRAISFMNADGDKDINILDLVNENNSWTEVTLPLSKLPGFAMWIANTSGASGEMVWLDQIYLTVQPDMSEYEKAIPEGAVMVEDFSDPIIPYNSPVWGSGAIGTSKWYQKVDDVYGVQAFGLQENDDFVYTLWGSLIPDDFDMTGYTHITFRLKANKDVLRAISFVNENGDKDINILNFVTENNGWTEVTLPISKLPGFAMWIANTSGASGEMLWIDQIYVETREDMSKYEKPIPEGAVMVEDFSETGNPSNSLVWGSGAIGISKWYEKIDGVYGVQAFGLQEVDDFVYTLWSGVIPDDFDFTGYTHITFRMKADLTLLRAVVLASDNSDINITDYISASNEWVDVKVPLSQIPGFKIWIANYFEASGEMLWIDQIFVTKEEIIEPDTPDTPSVSELPIPEGAKLISDFSTEITPHIPDNWGSGHTAGYYHSYDEYEGRAGVFGMGAKAGTQYMWYNAFGLNDMDLTGYKTITFRIMVRSGIRSLDIKHDDTEGINILNDVTEFDKWIELTYNIADLGFSDVSNACIQLRFANAVDAEAGEWVWLDQVYVSANEASTPEPDTPDTPSVNELPIPEGSVLVTDFSSEPSLWQNPNFGSGTDGLAKWYAEYDGVAGVQAFGFNSKEDWSYAGWTGVLPDFDYSGYNYITFRMKVNKEVFRAVWLTDFVTNVDILNNIPESNEWVTVTLKISDLTGFYLALANTWGASGEMIWMDQVYVSVNEPNATTPDTPSSNELAIPEGSKLISDFSSEITPHIPDSWGSGHTAGYYHSYDEYEGRAGVFGMGATSGSTFMWYNAFGLNDMDLTGYETLTFRIMVRSGIRSLEIKHDDTEGISILNDVTEFDKWIELTYNIADLGFSDVSKACIQLRFANAIDAEAGEWVWLDQVYASPKGKKVICDYSSTISPFIPDWWGSGPNEAYYNSYDSYDGKDGVFSMGTKGEDFIWYAGVGLESIDLTEAESISFVMKVKSGIRSLDLKHDGIEGYSLLPYITAYDEWITVTVPVSELSITDLSSVSLQFRFGTWNNGECEYVWLDEVYLNEKSEAGTDGDSNALPEGAVLVVDYTAAATPWNNPNWGTGEVGISNWHAELDGATGVQAFGFRENTDFCYTMWTAIIPDFDFSQYTNVTIRLKANKDVLRAVWFCNDTEDINFIDQISKNNEWVDVTLPLSEVPGFCLRLANTSGASGEMLWIDRIYVTK